MALADISFYVFAFLTLACGVLVVVAVPQPISTRVSGPCGKFAEMSDEGRA